MAHVVVVAVGNAIEDVSIPEIDTSNQQQPTDHHLGNALTLFREFVPTEKSMPCRCRMKDIRRE